MESSAVTKIPRMRQLNKETFFFFLMVLEAGKSKIKVQASLLPGENLLLTLQTDTLLCVLRRQRESKLWQVPLYKDTNPITGAPPS